MSDTNTRRGVQRLKLSQITDDPGLQPRADGLNEETVTEYAEAIRGGATFPPLVVYSDDTTGTTWLSEGFHRYAAYLQAKRHIAECRVRRGTRADALKNACGSNTEHGLRRTNADKRRAVELLLAAFPGLTNPRIATAAGVSVEFVRKVRPADEATREGGDGKQYPARRQSATVADSNSEIPSEYPDSAPPPVQPSLFDVPAEPRPPAPPAAAEQTEAGAASVTPQPQPEGTPGPEPAPYPPGPAGERAAKHLTRLRWALGDLADEKGRVGVMTAATNCGMAVWEDGDNLRWPPLEQVRNVLTELGVPE